MGAAVTQGSSRRGKAEGEAHRGVVLIGQDR